MASSMRKFPNHPYQSLFNMKSVLFFKTVKLIRKYLQPIIRGNLLSTPNEILASNCFVDFMLAYMLSMSLIKKGS